MYFIYVLKSKKDTNFYVGKTKNLKERLEEHKNGNVPSTRNRRPFDLVYCEVSRNVKDATHREVYLKTAWGKRYLKNRLKYDFCDI